MELLEALRTDLIFLDCAEADKDALLRRLAGDIARTAGLPDDESLYKKLYLARGPYFMGCKKPQADNPTEAGVPNYSSKDKHGKKVDCEF